MSLRHFVLAATFLVALSAPTAHAQKDSQWPAYGGNLAGQHYSPDQQINKSNVQKLKVAWTFNTGAVKISEIASRLASFEANPVFWHNTLYFSTPFDQVFAIDGASGRALWSFDSNVDRNTIVSIVTSRGVALWHSAKHDRKSAPCEDRVFLATLDARLLALDAQTGKPCEGFGSRGTVDLAASLHLRSRNWYEFTSPPTIVGDVVILGSSIGDNQAVEMASGAVRGFDARSGKLLWSWEPLPWAQNQHPRTGAGNAWSIISADPQHGLIYVPTGSPSPDFYGVYRPGDDRDADSVVALQAATGKRVWGFQTVHHDIWDYDVAAEPVLFQFRNSIPAVAITTKTGMLFVLNRLTGEPLYPVYEKPVPQSHVAGEKTSPTQPFSSLPTFAPLNFTADQVFGDNEKNRTFCHDKVAALANQGIFTPISTQSTLQYPGSIGGVNWGSPALDPKTGVLYVNVNRLAFNVRLVPRAEMGATLSARIRRKWSKWMLYWTPGSGEPAEERFGAPDGAGQQLNAQAGTPYMLFVEPLTSPDDLPCTPQPWGTMEAVNLNTGKKLWSQPLGTMIAGQHTGSISVGGPIVTAGDLIFSAATVEPLLRAFNEQNGQEVWRGPLPGPAHATPMTYKIGQRQFVVICSGGKPMAGGRTGDSVIAFALPAEENHSSKRSPRR
ncbi:MAG TPA: pyrroloquinoline quinone-dependent dehydrogenase [Acidobacteriaceae bacterium]|nr:pyrroloquinoline quinone-dependent dehydrogenase [Acidobacteriaceae bacterium]